MKKVIGILGAIGGLDYILNSFNIEGIVSRIFDTGLDASITYGILGFAVLMLVAKVFGICPLSCSKKEGTCSVK